MGRDLTFTFLVCCVCVRVLTSTVVIFKKLILSSFLYFVNRQYITFIKRPLKIKKNNPAACLRWDIIFWYISVILRDNLLNTHIKMVVPCQCKMGTLKNPTKCLWRWEPNRRNNFFVSLPAHLCRHTCNWNIVACDVEHQYTYAVIFYISRLTGNKCTIHEGNTPTKFTLFIWNWSTIWRSTAVFS